MSAIVTIDEVTPWPPAPAVNFAAQVDPKWRARHMLVTLESGRDFCINFLRSRQSGKLQAHIRAQAAMVSAHLPPLTLADALASEGIEARA